ncbi:putative membrane protein [Helicobacter pylori NQ4099]|uniref:Putative membrane protein n=1 Tax=Helicobacter pylori NQ4099 TaxID=992026 RepID=I9YWS6_HELPX|nr:putative membrane protein [Helicobacter pylori NQ4099]
MLFLLFLTYCVFNFYVLIVCFFTAYGFLLVVFVVSYFLMFDFCFWCFKRSRIWVLISFGSN